MKEGRVGLESQRQRVIRQKINTVKFLPIRSCELELLSKSFKEA